MTRTTTPGIEWQALRLPLLVLLAVILLSTAATYGSRYYLAQSRAEQEHAEAELERITKLYDETRKAVDIINSSYAQFATLYQRGFLGDEQKLLWVNQLHKLESLLELPYLQYDISKAEQRFVIDADALTLDDAFQVYESAMTLKIGLIHEGDLFHLLKTFRDLPPAGFFTVKNCELLRQSETDYSAKRPNIQTTCQLSWFTARIDETRNKR